MSTIVYPGFAPYTESLDPANVLTISVPAAASALVEQFYPAGSNGEAPERLLVTLTGPVDHVFGPNAVRVSFRVSAIGHAIGVSEQTASADQLSEAASSSLFIGGGIPHAEFAMIVSVTTSAVGSEFVPWPAQPCAALDVVNTDPAAVDLEIRRGASGNTIIVPAGTARMFVALADASELQLRRQDMANGTVSVTAEALS